MVRKLYGITASPPVRSVLLTAKVLGIELELLSVDLRNKEQFSPEFQKLNPQGKVPVLQDGDFVLADSHAIITYLVNKYKPDSSLYPQDPCSRALVDNRLHFDSNALFPSLLAISRPIVLDGEKSVPPEKAEVVKQNWNVLEKLLEGHDWAAGNSITLADFSLIPTATSLNVMVPFDEATHPNIDAWIKRAEKWPYYKENQEGLDQYRQLVKSSLEA